MLFCVFWLSLDDIMMNYHLWHALRLKKIRSVDVLVFMHKTLGFQGTENISSGVFSDIGSLWHCRLSGHLWLHSKDRLCFPCWWICLNFFALVPRCCQKKKKNGCEIKLANHGSVDHISFMNMAQDAAEFAERLKIKVAALPKLDGCESEPQVVSKLSVLCWQPVSACSVETVETVTIAMGLTKKRKSQCTAPHVDKTALTGGNYVMKSSLVTRSLAFLGCRHVLTHIFCTSTIHTY